MSLTPSTNNKDKEKDKDGNNNSRITTLTTVTAKKKPSTVGNTKVWFWANECKYEVILDNVAKMKWRLITDEKYEPKCNIYWIDVATIHERFRTIQPWQIINHFPGMPNIARKNRMGQNLNRMLKMFPVNEMIIALCRVYLMSCVLLVAGVFVLSTHLGVAY
jgi:hypothetical protein